MWLRSKNTYTDREINLLISSVHLALCNDLISLKYGAELRLLKQKLLKEKLDD